MMQSSRTSSIKTVRSVGIGAALSVLTEGLFKLSALALLAAGIVLTYGVITAHATGTSIVWQDEVTIFLVAGAMFLAAASVQGKRGHIGIELMSDFLSPRANAARHMIVDVLSFAFCAVFAWKTGALLNESIVDAQTSNSASGSPAVDPLSDHDDRHGDAGRADRVPDRAALCRRPVDHCGRGCGVPRLAQRLLAVEAFRDAAVQGCVTRWDRHRLLHRTLLVMFSGMPIAFALGAVALIFMLLFMPHASVDTIAQNVYQELANIIILAIPLFILKGAAIGRSNAGKDLYLALHAWLHRIPGGLGVANTVACGLFAAMAGSSPATCSAIGSAGIPEMRARGYSPGFAAGIIAAGGTLGILLPPSVTMLLYAVAAEVSLGKLFLAGIGPGLLLITMFAAYSVYRFKHEKTLALETAGRTGVRSAILHEDNYTLIQKLKMIGWVVPFVSVLAGVMIVLYAGWASPSETAGVGAVLALLVIGAMYGIWRPSKLMPILQVRFVNRRCC